jgi:hypothetical protein
MIEKFEVHARGKVVLTTTDRYEAKRIARFYDGIIFAGGMFIKHEKFEV